MICETTVNVVMNVLCLVRKTGQHSKLILLVGVGGLVGGGGAGAGCMSACFFM